MNEMTEERASELIHTKGEVNQTSPPTRIYRSHSCLLGWKNSHAWTFGLTEANNYLSPQYHKSHRAWYILKNNDFWSTEL